MNTKPSSKNLTIDAATLRQKAEDLLKKKLLKTGLQLPVSEVQKLIHELQVHQVELELQNEELELAKEQAEVASQKYAELYDLAPSGYFTLSDKGEIIELNLLGAQMLGKEWSLLKNSMFGFFVSDETKPIFSLFLRKVFSGNAKESCEVALSENGNSTMYVHLTGIVIGNRKQCLVTIVDITTQKRALELVEISNRQKNLILEAAGEGILGIDLAGNLTFVNPMAAKILGYRVEELPFKNSHGLFHHHHRDGSIYPPEDCPIYQTLHSGKPAYGEEVFLRKNGTYFPVGFSSLPVIENEKITGAVVTFRDITEHKQAEEARQKSAEQFHSLYMNMIDGATLSELTYNDQGVPDNYILIETNPAFETQLGVSGSSVVGKTGREIYGLSEPPFLEIYSQVDQTGEPIVFETYFQPLAKYYSILIYCPYKGRLATIFKDITERKRAEQALIDSKARAHALIDAIPDLIFRLNKQGVYLDYKAAKEELAFQAESIIGKKNRDITPPEFADLVDEKIRLTLQTEQMQEFEYQLSLPNKGICEFDARMVPCSSDEVIVIVRDVTERKQVEKALRDSEQRYRLLIETVNEGILVAQNGLFKFVNPMMQVITGFTQNELLTLPFIDFVYPEDRKIVINNHLKRLKGEQFLPRYQFRMVKKDGSIRRIEMNGIVIEWENQPATLNMLTDITERTQAEEALQHERTLLRLLIDNVPDLMYTKDTAGRKTLVNIAEVQNIGVKLESEVLGKDDFAFFPKEMAEKFFADDLSVIQTGRPLINKEEYTLNELGQEKWFLTSKFPLRDQGGQIIGLAGIGRDITKHKKAEEELRESEERFRHLFELSPEAIMLIDPSDDKVDWPIVDCNETACKMNGYTREELVGKSIDIINISAGTAEERAVYLEKLKQAPLVHLETFHRHRDGHIFPTEVSTSLVTFLGREMVLGIDRDITERKQAEEEIRLKNQQLHKLIAEKDKFFSIISHDLRSPFSGFLGLTELMAEDLPSLTMDEIQQFSVNMRNSATNLYRLLENLLQWSRMQQGSIPFNPEVIQLRSIVDECIPMAKEPAKNKGIDLKSDIPENLKVFADNNMVQTIVRNLVSNALKFTRKGGKISVSATATGDKSVEISVKDSGIGMKPEMVGNLFRLDVKTNRKGTEDEPSTGLGLLLCKEFVEKLGGRIWVESEEGNGTTFYFTLPINAK